ncbi:deSI-like protein At4g17486 [Selaginella moellendorffii]|nr:deSI-like protein At4g17486 [Selaginella moellendorffii]|eukprot:XP_002994019.2 deSI-like protein At4g17486 [Selaginella moellendorffii]
MGLTNFYQQLGSTSSSSSPSPSPSPSPEPHKESVPVFLNVYDLTAYNDYAYWFGLGIFHSGVEVHGVEYAFGAHEFPTSGVFEVEPRRCPGFMFRTSIRLGSTTMGPLQLRQFVETVASHYNGDTYHLLLKNCNHFSEDITMRLVKHPIPSWVNRVARIGWLCRCFLPECLQLTAAQQICEIEEEDSAQEENGDSTACKPAKDDEHLMVSEETIKAMLQQERTALI